MGAVLCLLDSSSVDDYKQCLAAHPSAPQQCEGLRLAREAGFEFISEQEMIPPECLPLTDPKIQYGAETFARLIALARQRPGWVLREPKPGEGT